MARAIVLVHGLFSSTKTWSRLRTRITGDDDFAGIEVREFPYYSPKLHFSPLKAIPDHDDVAKKLWTWITVTLEPFDKILIITHSQGGLIVQRMLANQVRDANAEALKIIDQIVLLACPNSGSELFLGLRRRWSLLSRNRQVRALAPVDKDIEQTRTDVIDRVVYATEVSATQCPIPITAYAGEKDNIVKTQSALAQFKRRGVIDGDHFSILRFDKPDSMNYAVVRKHLISFVALHYEEVEPPMPLGSGLGASGSAIVGALPHEAIGFVARSAARKLLDTFSTGHSPVVCSLTGMRGVGKTQAAAAFARGEIGRGCPLVGWVNAETQQEMLAGLSRIARYLGIGDSEGDSFTNALLLRERLQTWATDCLLIFDNAQVEQRVLHELIPAAGPARIVITSTAKSYADLGVSYEIAEFTPDESVEYLRSRTSIDDDAGAGAVAYELGYLPLALAQAASTINGQRLNYADYLRRLNTVPVAALLGGAWAAVEYPVGVSAAFLLSIEALCAGNSADDRRHALEIIACLSPEGISRRILYALTAADGGTLSEAQVDEVLGSCVGASLLLWSEDGALVIMHRLVARVIRETAVSNERWADVLTKCVTLLESQLVPEREAWSRREFGAQLAGEVEALWRAARAGGADPGGSSLTERLINLRFWAVRQLWKAADLTLAVRLGERVAADCRRINGDEDPQSLTAAFNLAVAYESSGRMREAIRLLERVAASREDVFGPRNPSTVTARQQLASANRSAGQIHSAMELFELVLPVRRELLGDAHPDTIATRIDLAGTYESVGRLNDAVPLFELGLAQRIGVLGELDPHTLSARKHLAAAYESAGRVHDAIDLFQLTLAQRQSALGVDHPHTLISWNDLAHAYEADGRLDDAELLYKQNVADRTRTLGQDHPDTISSSNDLAYIEFLLGDIVTADRICRETSARADEILGSDHPNAINLVSTLGWCRLATGAVGDAVDRFVSVLSGRKKMLGDQYPDTIAARHDLGIAHFLLGNETVGLEMLQRATSDFETILGVAHPITKSAGANVSTLRALPASSVGWSDICGAVKIPRWRPGRRIVKRALD